jgi:hypothetical protein
MDIWARELTTKVDCSIAVFRVHLLGNHVLPLFLFHSWFGPRLDFDGCDGWLCVVHFIDRLASLESMLPMKSATDNVQGILSAAS